MSFDVRNTGTRPGAEVVQVYLGLPAATVEPPRRLVAWQKVLLQPNQKQHVTVAVAANSSSHPLSYWNVRMRSWQIAQGEYAVYIGKSSRDLTLAGTFLCGRSHGRRLPQ